MEILYDCRPPFTDLINVSNPDIDFNIGGVTLHSEKFDPIQGRDTIDYPLEKWQIEGTSGQFRSRADL